MDDWIIDWTQAADHMWSRHQIPLSWAQEALRDHRNVVLDPDPASNTGTSVRVLGYSARAGTVLVVIIVKNGTQRIAATAWPANRTQARRYWEGTSAHD